MSAAVAARVDERGRRSRRDGTAVLLLVAPIGLLLLVVGYPVLVLLQESVSGPAGWGVYGDLAGADLTRTVLLRTLATAGLITLVCLLLGYPYAYLMTLAGPVLRTVLVVLVLLPFWTSFTIRTLAWVVLLQDQGLVNDGLAGLGLPRLPLIRNVGGVVVGTAHVLLPYAVLPMYAVMRRIDRRLVDAASVSGASRTAAWRQVYLPISVPGVVAGSALVFILSLGFFLTPQLLGSSRNAVLSQLIYTYVSRLGDTATAAALGMVLLVVTLLVLLLIAAALRWVPRVGGGGVR